MAVRHSQAGRVCKSKAARIFDLVLTGVIVVAVAFGCCIGIFLVKRWTVSGVLALAGATLFAFLSTKLLNSRVERLGKERLKWWRGGQVEELVSWILEDLPNDWHIFNGLMLQGGRDIDHVLVGPGGVFVISTKSQRGMFSMASDGRRIFCNQKPTGFINDVWEQADQVRARLAAFLVNEVPQVQAVLAVPFAWTECQSKRNDIWVLHQENLLDAFAKSDRVLPPENVAKLARLFKKLLVEGREFYTPPKTAAATALQ